MHYDIPNTIARYERVGKECGRIKETVTEIADVLRLIDDLGLTSVHRVESSESIMCDLVTLVDAEVSEMTGNILAIMSRESEA